jgi:phage terminase large subunit-like protein
MDLDPFSDEAIKQANPHFDVFMNKDEVRRQAEEARRMPSRESSFRNLILNQRVEARDPFITRSVWMDNGAMPKDIGSRPVFGGLDLSAVNDLTSLVLLCPDEGSFDVHSTFWLPEDGLFEKSRADRVPYDLWAKDGFLQTTPGKSIEYEWVASYLRNLFDTNDVRAIAFDRYNMRFLKPWLEKVGFTEEELERFKDFGQGFVSMSPALRELESALLNRKLRHGNHPVLTMCAQNATVQTDAAQNRKFVKAKATGRIDGMVALAMAVGVMPNQAADDTQTFDDYINNPLIL